MRYLFIAIAATFFFIFSIGAQVTGAAQAPPESVFQQLQRTASGVRTLSSDFVQEKHLSMFKTVVSSKGRFNFNKPDQLRWEITAPVASGFVLKGDKGRRWHAHTGRTESFQISQEPVMKLVADQLLSWAQADFARIQKEYRITVLDDAPVSLRLEPTSATTAGFLRYLLVSFSPDGRYVRTVEVHEQDGDFTRIKFVNTAVNKPLKADLF
ncbi:outer membrane lipoprotein carrier protein LolA [Geomonas sp. RF6]|uniref:LolA family protein n=1 Tax=Geomonas sp. RF6 TaxID=2897342 RepID=UPI001E487DF5|nr:outer membrane lipoprotein carrier protein LolA [Geomonas sp. RF6]UFS69363.1 outer membrane lipoprotein carrier protein LolA [Geomonas sp. RF6]